MQAETLEVLEKAEIPAPHARAIARAIDIEIAASRQTLATRGDLLLESEKLRSGFQELKQSFKALEARIEAKIESFKSEILNRMYAALLGQMALLLGLAYFFFNSLR